ncbi:MAG TPA: S9 family peptidase [Acidimicrobiia bacterium]|nr:S9 family peptidase [Acidimicrobiia bacterium]
MGGTPEPPRAPRRPTELRHGDDVRVDDWYWLRDRDDPAVRSLLEAENDYLQVMLAPQAGLRDTVFDEITTRVVETDVSAPVRRGAFEYYTRTRAGLEYAVHCRRPVRDAPLDPDAPPGQGDEQVLLDENVLAGDSDYFALRGLALSPDQVRLAYSVDRTGGERAELHVRDLTTGTDLPDTLPDVYYGLGWANDERSLFYVRPDATMRPFQVWCHRLGSPASADRLVFEEPDERFYLAVRRARSGRLLLIDLESKVTTEAWLLDADEPDTAPRLVAAREEGVEYRVEHHRAPSGEDRLFLVTNVDGAENFQLMVTDTASPGREHWQTVLPGQDDVRLDRVDAFARHLIVSERRGGMARLRALDLAGGATPVAVGDDVATTWLGPSPEYEGSVVRVASTSLVTPMTDYDHDLETGVTTVVKQQPVAGYEPDRYETHRLWAPADDGTKVPISVVCRRGQPWDGTGPMMLYGYGAYEISIDPTFSISRLSLLERGAAYAIAHVRGGGELGRRWYTDGKLDRKRNTFTDFVACARHLVDEGLTTPARLVARGGSAGGLTMGAVLNEAPDLWRAVVAEVPFVDCLTTMLDPSLPLTITEYDEWGNPAADDHIYEYLRGYSPYDNVAPVAYPTILATGGLNDPRVQYWEPAKWVQKVRATTTGRAVTLLKTELDAGHHGRSGRYESWREEAFVLAFVLDALGLSA